MASRSPRALAAAIVTLGALAVGGLELLRNGREPASRPVTPARPAAPQPPGAEGPVATASPTQPAGAVGLGRVEGTVRDALTAAPLAGVDVIFEGGGGETTAASGPGGHFAADLAPGRYRVRAAGEDVLGLEVGTLAVGAGARVDGFDVRVARLAAVAGRIVDADGEPVAGAEVSFDTLLPRGHVASRDLGPPGAAESAADGTFELRVMPGEVAVLAERDGARGRTVLPYVAPGASLAGVEIVLDAGATVRGVVRDPSGAAVAGATVLAVVTPPPGGTGGRRGARTDGDGRFTLTNLPAGRARLEAQAAGFAPSAPYELETASADEVTLTLRAPLAIAGRVLAPDGAPVEGARVSARAPGSSLEPPAVATGADGAFRLAALAGGPFDLVAEHEGYAAARRAGVAAPADGVELQLAATGGLHGVVTDDRGAPVAQFGVRIERWRAAGAASGVPGALQPTQFVAADGAWRLEGLEPGSYDLLVSAPGYAPARKAGVVVPPGGWGDGSLRLGAGATIEGRVTAADSGAPVAGARVSALTGWEGDEVLTGADGRFVLRDLAPGRRSVAVEHPEFVTRNEGGVELGPGERRLLDVALSPAEPGPGRAIEFGGIGVGIGFQAERLVLNHVVPGGPGDVAGLRAGDEIVAVDGVPAAGRPLADIMEAIRGVVGTPVRLEIRRGGDSPFIVDVVRATVRFRG